MTAKSEVNDDDGTDIDADADDADGHLKKARHG